MKSAAWRLTLAASTLMGLAAGSRLALGLIVPPLNTVLGMGFSALSLALALGQLGLGLAQLAIGALRSRSRWRAPECLGGTACFTDGPD